MRHSALVLFCGALLLALLAPISGCSRDLSERPPETSPTDSISGRRSTVAIPVAVNLALVEARINELLPQVIAPIDGDVRKKGKILGIKYSASADLSGSIQRDGRIRVSGQGDALHIEIPIRFGVTARPNGDIGRKILGLRESAEGKLTVFGDLRLNLKEDWTPVLKLDTDYKWRDRAHFSVFGIKVTFAGKLEKPIDKALKDIEASAASLIDPADLEEKLHAGWKAMHEPIPVSSDPPAWIALTPHNVAFSGVATKDNILRATLLVEADSLMVLGAKPAGTVAGALPALKQLPADGPTGFNINIPLSLTYAGMRNAILAAAPIGKTIAFSSAAGDGRVTLEELVVYPSHGKLVVGAKINADLQDKWLDVKGWFYLSALPQLDHPERKLHLSGLTLSRQTDNFFVSTATSLAAIEPVRQLLEDSATIAYADEYLKVQRLASAGVSVPVAKDVTVRGTVSKLEPGTFKLTTSGLMIPVLAEGSLDIIVGL